MNALLVEAIHQLDLKPGEAYSATVEGHTVEIRKGEIDPVPEENIQPMVMPWFDVPDPPGGYLVRVKIEPSEKPSPYRLDESDLAPGYLEDSHDLSTDES